MNPPTQPQPPARAEQTFISALSHPPGEREAYVAAACGSDTVLMAEVRGLLAAHEAADGFLKTDAPLSPEVERELARLKPEDVGEMIGPYKLREQIGEGGFGTVWVADQEKPVRRRVALKIIKLGMDTKEVIARFEQERQALAMMDHPNIARVFDAGATQFGRPFFVMEFVRGIPITDYCDQNNLPTLERLGLFIAVCQAVQHAHQKGIIHRDIKPSNIIVTLHDGVPVPKVIDFGIAKATEGRLTDATVYTQMHQFVGTPAYMSPEQAEMSGLDIDTRSDIYSLGVLLYELLAGSTPFDAKELMASGIDAMRKTIREKEPQRPSTRLATLGAEQLTTTARRRSTATSKLLHQLTGDLDWIVMKCLEKDRTRRYETASGLAADLKRHLNHEPVLARPPSKLYEFQRMVRRHKFGFAAAGAILAVLAAGIAATVWQAVRATKLRAAAETAGAGETAQRQAAEVAQASETKLRKLAQVQAYAADMKAAQAALQQGSRQQAVTLLDQYWPKPGEPDLRGVEWRYLWQATKGEELYTWKHPGMVPGALFSPDGRQVATACFDGMLRIWEIASGKLVAQFDRAVRDDSVRVSFCYSPDGTTLASAARDGIILLDCETWQVKRTLELPTAEGGGVTYASLTFSPDGQWLAAGFSGRVRVWKTGNWESVRLPKGSYGRVAFSPDSKTLLTTTHLGPIEAWDLATQTNVNFVDPKNHTWDLARFSPSGEQLLSGNGRGNVDLWDVRSSTVIWSVQAHRSRIFGLAFSHDGKRFASAAYDQHIHIWDTATGEKLMTLQGHLNEIWSVEFSPDDRHLLTSSKDGTVKLWDAQTKPQPNSWMLDEGESPIGFTPNGRGLISIASKGTTVRHRNGAQVVKSLTFDQPYVRNVTVFSPRSQCLYALRPGNEVQVYDVNTLKVKRSFHIEDRCERLYNVSPDERWLAGVGGGILHVWDTSSGKSVAHFREIFAGGGSYNLASFSPDSHSLAFATAKWEVQLWDTGTRQDLRTLGPHPWRVIAINFSPDGRHLASSSWEGDARIFETATGKEIVAPLYGHGSGVHEHTFSPEGATLVTAGDDCTVRFWNFATGREMLVFNNASFEYARLPLLSPTGELAVWYDKLQSRYRVESIPTMTEIEKARRAETIAP